MKRKFKNAVPSQTQTAGTAIVAGMHGRRNHFTSVDRMHHTTDATNLHVVTIMKPATRTTLSANANASQAVINVTAALTDGGGNAIASGDYVAVELVNGTYHFTTFVSAATLAYTLAANLPLAAKKNGNVFCYGVVGDSFQDQIFKPTINQVDFSLPASPNAESNLYTCLMMDAPLIYYNPNGTGADILKTIEYSHCKIQDSFHSCTPWLNQNAGTAIVGILHGRRNCLTKAKRMQLTSGSTAHLNSFLKAASRTTLSADAAAAQGVINVTAALTDGAGNAVASGDYIAVELANGLYHVATFTSAATLAYTLGSNLPSAAKKGGYVFCYGVAGDSFQDQTFTPTVSITDLIMPNSPQALDALAMSPMMDAPLIYYNPNASNADTIKGIEYANVKI